MDRPIPSPFLGKIKIEKFTFLFVKKKKKSDFQNKIILLFLKIKNKDE